MSDTPAKKRKPRGNAKRVAVRPLRMEDFEAVCALQLKCFPGMKPWKREQFESQLRLFAEGQLCVEIDGRLVASSSSLVVDFDLYDEWQNWSVIADSGFIRNHDPAGNTMYGIEIMVDPDYRGYRLSRRLYDARKQIARDMNLMRIIIGGRMPGYHKHAHELTAREYADKVIAKELIDPVLTAQLSNGFVLQRLIPDYLPNDKESMGYATFLEWTNYDYRSQKRRKWRVVEIVRLAVVQYQMRPIDAFGELVKNLRYFVDVAADQQADFVVFPELIATPLMGLYPGLRPGLVARKLHEHADALEEEFRRMAIKYNVNIVGGSHFRMVDGKLYNRGGLYHRDGRMEFQDKLHITPAERRWWGVTPGRELAVFDTDCGKVAIMLCYDAQFPELGRIAARKGAQILFVPFNTDDRNGYLRVRNCARARAIENHVYVVLAGATGNLPFVDNADTHYAQSGIFTPSDYSFARDGIAEECSPDEETVIISDVDIELLRRHRYTGTTTNWADRRTDMYTLRYRDGGDQKEL